LATQLSESIVDRVDRFAAPLWDMKLDVAKEPDAQRYCLDPQPLDFDSLSTEQKSLDKLIWLGVRVERTGYELTCREFDVYLRQWGPLHRRRVSQATFLPEACFELLTSSFTPLAHIAVLPDDAARVELTFKGSGLPRPPGAHQFVTPGEVFQPLYRRTDRNGELMENGVIPASWTYLTTASEADGRWLADVHTGVRRAFGIQRGRVEQIAVALRNSDGPTTVRFHARNDPKMALAGYEVFRDRQGQPPQAIGVTDRDGAIEISPADDSPISMVLLRSAGQVLAKVPVPTGGDGVIEIPIADNTARLRAQAEAQAIREQLIDIVARRQIMMARVKALLKKNRVEDARKLMAELDALPGSSDFARSLDALERRIPQTDDPTVKRTIDKLFASTRELLGKFLDRRPIIDLQTQVNNAQAAARDQDPAPPS
jgi:hypothetical protein